MKVWTDDGKHLLLNKYGAAGWYWCQSQKSIFPLPTKYMHHNYQSIRKRVGVTFFLSSSFILFILLHSVYFTSINFFLLLQLYFTLYHISNFKKKKNVYLFVYWGEWKAYGQWLSSIKCPSCFGLKIQTFKVTFNNAHPTQKVGRRTV